MDGDDVGGQTLDPVLNKVYDTWYYNVEPKYDSSYKTRFKPVKFETIGNVGKPILRQGKYYQNMRTKFLRRISYFACHTIVNV